MNSKTDLPFEYRIPDKKTDTSTPIKELVANGEPVQHIRKKIVYEYRPLYTLAFVICFCFFTYAILTTIEQLSANATARACFEAGGSWGLDKNNHSECKIESK
jgi:hypothetical protein